MGVRKTMGHAGCLLAPALALSAVASLVGLGSVVVPRHVAGVARLPGSSTAPAALTAPDPSSHTGTPPSLAIPPPTMNLGDCLNEANHNATLVFDVVRVMRTPGAVAARILDRTMPDRITATRLAAEAAGWPELFDYSTCRAGPLGQWYALSFAAKSDLNDWEVFVPAQLCDSPSAPRLCADMASVLGMTPGEPPRLLVEGSVHVVRTPGLLVLPQVDRTITDRVVAGRLADDIRGLRPWAIEVPNSRDVAVSCPMDYGTSYTLTFTSPGSASWTATIGILGCSLVSIPGWPTLLDFGATPLLDDLGTALGLSPDELVPVACGGPVWPGHRCYPQPPLPTPH
jgi:hypothetical protein